jgi:hypothetical protein
MNKKLLPLLPLALCLALLSGCASYVTPGGRADLSGISSASMKESFAARPAAVLPAGIAAVRVQSPGYRNYHTMRAGGVHGGGRFSVITVREFETQEDFERIARLPEVGGLIGLSPLLIPENLRSDLELREAAARLKADLLLLYTFNTTFHDNDASVALKVITLGLSPTKKIFVRVNASALLVDTRTGFIYGAFDANERRELRSNSWESEEAADRARLSAEKAAFQSLLDEFVKSWPDIRARAKQGV